MRSPVALQGREMMLCDSKNALQGALNPVMCALPNSCSRGVDRRCRIEAARSIPLPCLWYHTAEWTGNYKI